MSDDPTPHPLTLNELDLFYLVALLKMAQTLFTLIPFEMAPEDFSAPQLLQVGGMLFERLSREHPTEHLSLEGIDARREYTLTLSADEARAAHLIVAQLADLYQSQQAQGVLEEHNQLALAAMERLLPQLDRAQGSRG